MAGAECGGIETKTKSLSSIKALPLGNAYKRTKFLKTDEFEIYLYRFRTE